MAKDIETIRQEATLVRDATRKGENTAERVGGVMFDLAEHINSITADDIDGLFT